MPAFSRTAEAVTPSLSVIILTYNHQLFIEKAIRSVLEQIAAPNHEILVAEDYSTDQTRKIISSLEAEFPGRLNVLDRGRNLGLSANLEDAWKRSSGKYISILEGDDYWCDQQKLAKTHAAMEAHPEWVGCFHAVRQINQIGRPIFDLVPCPFPDRPLTFQDFLIANHIPTYSCVTYRRGIVTEFPAWHRKLVAGDWALHLLHTEHGVIGFLPETMTIYHAHPNGMWSGMPDVRRWKQVLLLLESINQHYDGKYASEIDETRETFYKNLEQTFVDLRRIEKRYFLLQLDHIAAFFKWFKDRLPGRK